MLRGGSPFSMFGQLRRRISGGTIRIALALILVVGASVLYWTSRDYAVIAPNWDGLVRGISYTPSHNYTEKDHEWTSPEKIDGDMAQISQTHRPCPHLHRLQRARPSPRDRPPPRLDRFAGDLDRLRFRFERKGNRDGHSHRAGQPGTSTGFSSATNPSCAATSAPTS